jgi:hypothetical protein
LSNHTHHTHHTPHTTHTTACGATRFDQTPRRRAGGRLHSIRQGTTLTAHAHGTHTHTTHNTQHHTMHDLCTHTTPGGAASRCRLCRPTETCWWRASRSRSPRAATCSSRVPTAAASLRSSASSYVDTHPRRPTATANGPDRGLGSTEHTGSRYGGACDTRRRAVCGRCTAVRW